MLSALARPRAPCHGGALQHPLHVRDVEGGARVSGGVLLLRPPSGAVIHIFRARSRAGVSALEGRALCGDAASIECEAPHRGVEVIHGGVWHTLRRGVEARVSAGRERHGLWWRRLWLQL